MKPSWIWALAVAASLGCSGANRGSTAFEAEDAAPDAGPPNSQADDAGASGGYGGEDGGGALGALEGGGGSPTCTPGQYVGTYTGTNDSSKVGGPTNFPISGPFAIDLVSAQMNGEDFLAVNNGTFDLAWGTTGADASSGLIVINATLTGNLNCANGDFAASDPSAPWTTLGIPSGTATVDFTGTYDPSAATISGTFNITDSLSTSTGTWTVTLSP